MTGGNLLVGHDDDGDDHDDGGDDDGYPAYSHQSYSHQVGICHNDEGWEYDTVTFPPCINPLFSLHFCHHIFYHHIF